MYIKMYITSMAKRYSIAEARANLPRLVDEAEAGGEVEITRRGKAVAVVLSRSAYLRLRSERPSFGDAYRAFTAKHSLDEAGIDEAFFEELRDSETGREVDL